MKCRTCSLLRPCLLAASPPSHLLKKPERLSSQPRQARGSDSKGAPFLWPRSIVCVCVSPVCFFCLKGICHYWRLGDTTLCSRRLRQKVVGVYCDQTANLFVFFSWFSQDVGANNPNVPPKYAERPNCHLSYWGIAFVQGLNMRFVHYIQKILARMEGRETRAR